MGLALTGCTSEEIATATKSADAGCGFSRIVKNGASLSVSGQTEYTCTKTGGIPTVRFKFMSQYVQPGPVSDQLQAASYNAGGLGNSVTTWEVEDNASVCAIWLYCNGSRCGKLTDPVMDGSNGLISATLTDIANNTTSLTGCYKQAAQF